jgi:hypothetical protein
MSGGPGVAGGEVRPASADAPPRRSSWPRADLGERILQGFIVGVLAAILAVGLLLTPLPTGTGTHTLLGLGPCGMLLVTGRPCPTCGITTSLALAAHGRFADAFVNQPMGLLLFALTLLGLVFGVVTIIAGRSWATVVTLRRAMIVAVALVALGLVSWIYKWNAM